jgi:ComF family protein
LELAEAAKFGWRVDHPNEYCLRCGATTGTDGATRRGCPNCLRQRLPWDRVVRLGVYDDPMSWWVWQLKYHKQWAWARVLGPILAESIREAEVHAARRSARAQPRAATFVVEVPMHPVRRWGRGFNQSRLLAQEISWATSWPLLPALRRVRNTRPQVTLPLSGRAANVRDSFAIDAVDLRGCCVWLIDDVKTTGATIRACAKLLKQNGASEINVAVLAVARGRHEPPLRHRRGLPVE